MERHTPLKMFLILRFIINYYQLSLTLCSMLFAFIKREPGIVSAVLAVSDKLGQRDEHFPFHLLHSHDCCLGHHLHHHAAHGHLHCTGRQQLYQKL